MFGKGNKKLDAWYSALPSELKKTLESKDVSDWSASLHTWFTTHQPASANAKETTPTKTAPKDEMFDMAAQISKDAGAVSERLLVSQMNISEAKSTELIEKLTDAGLITAGSPGSIHKSLEARGSTSFDERTLDQVFSHLMREGTISQQLIERKFNLSAAHAALLLESIEKAELVSPVV